MLNALSLITAVYSVTTVGGHIGEPCNRLLNICIPPSSHVFCDSNNVCRCKAEYPVQVSAHSCSKPRKYSERCKFQEECVAADPNSHCTQAPYLSQCECMPGFVYNYENQLCVTEDSSLSSSHHSMILPSAAVFLTLLVLIVLCCCVCFWRSACNKERSRNSFDSGHRLRNFTLNDTIESPLSNRLSTDNTANLPSYDTVYDEEPPKYEDAVKYSYHESELPTAPEYSAIPKDMNI